MPDTIQFEPEVSIDFEPEGPTREEKKAAYKQQKAELEMAASQGRGLENLAGFGERVANTVAQMHPLAAIRPFVNPYRQVLIPPEVSQKVVESIGGPAAEGSALQGVQQFAGEMISGLSAPENLAALAVPMVAPSTGPVIGRLFQTEMAGAIPEQIQQLRQAQTTPEVVKAGLNLAATPSMIAGIEYGLSKPKAVAPTDIREPAMGSELKLPKGAERPPEPEIQFTPETKGEPNAESIRASEGQLPQERIEPQGIQETSGNVVEQKPSEQPQPVVQGGKPEAQGEVLLREPKAEPILVSAQRRGSDIRLEFDASQGKITAADIERMFASPDWSVSVTAFKPNEFSTAQGRANFRVDIGKPTGEYDADLAKRAYLKALGTEEAITGKSAIEQQAPLEDRLAATIKAAQNREAKPPPSTSETAPEVPAPSAATGELGNRTVEQPAVQPPAISEAKPVEQKTQLPKNLQQDLKRAQEGLQSKLPGAVDYGYSVDLANELMRGDWKEGTGYFDYWIKHTDDLKRSVWAIERFFDTKFERPGDRERVQSLRNFIGRNIDITEPTKQLSESKITGMGGATLGEKPAQAQGAVAAPPLPPLPTGSTVIPVKPLSQIIRDLSKGLTVPIRFKRLTTTKFAGYFKGIPNLIGAKRPNDIPIVTHEVGHKLDQLLSFSGNPAIAAELHILGDPTTPGSLSSWKPSKTVKYKLGEGMAEFVRRWATDPADAARLAPNTNAAFERALNSNPDLSSVMRQAQKDIGMWRTAQPEARLRSSISTSNPNGTRMNLPAITRDLVDDLHFMNLAVDTAKESGTLKPSQDPYVLSRLLRGSYGMADTFIRKGQVDFNTGAVRLGTGLEDALKPVAGKIDEFRTWIVAKRAKELIGRAKETGLVPADVDFVVAKYDGDPSFQAAFQNIKAWNDSLLQYAVDSGMLSPDSAKVIRDMNEDYVPFHRVMEIGAGETAAQSSAGVGRGLQVGKPGSLKGIKGSKRDIIDPLETMVKNAYAIVTSAEKNRISQAMGDLANRQNMGKWIERVSGPKEAVKFELDRIRKQLTDAGADVSMLKDDFLMMFWKPSKRAPFGENTIAVNRGGKIEFYRLNKDLYETFHALDYEDSGKLIQFLSMPAQVLRAGVTLTPDFATMNALRDTLSAPIISKHGGSLPFINTIRGLGMLLKNPQIVSEWAAAGGKQAIEASYFDRNKLQKFITEKITKDLTPAEQATVYLKSPLTALRLLTGTFEEATRLGEYRVAYDKYIRQGMDPIDARKMAAFDARDLQDFAKGGAHTKVVRRLAAFWNAALQGNVRLFQAFRDRPFQTTLKGIAFITLPKLLEQAINYNDQDYWDRPQWERDLFFMIPYGKDNNGRTKFIRIPTPFEVGLIFGTLPGRVIQYTKEHNSDALSGYFSTLLKQTIPNPVPNALMVPLELAAGRQGYSYWRGRPIVSEALKDKSPELQFTEQTSLTAKRIGNTLHLSPQKLDYAIGGFGGGVAKQVVGQGVDRVISGITGEPRTAKQVAPFGRFFATPAGTQSDAIEKFYDLQNKVYQDQSLKKAGKPTSGLYIFDRAMRKRSDALSQMRRQMQKEQNPDEKQRIQLRMAQLAKDTLELVRINKP